MALTPVDGVVNMVAVALAALACGAAGHDTGNHAPVFLPDSLDEARERLVLLIAPRIRDDLTAVAVPHAAPRPPHSRRLAGAACLHCSLPFTCA